MGSQTGLCDHFGKDLNELGSRGGLGVGKLQTDFTESWEATIELGSNSKRILKT